MSILEQSVTIGTRGSNLALWQAHHVAGLLERLGVSARLETVITKGDRNLEETPSKIGDKGLFTAELDEALLSGRIDLAVHSLKDMPAELPEGLRLAAVPERGSPWDVLVPRVTHVRSISDLPEGARVGTSSLRRAALLLAARPDISVMPIRGNVETRLQKLEDERLDALVLAEAGLVRLGLEQRIGARFPPEVMLPAVGQGALGVVCASDRDLLSKTLWKLTHPHTYASVLAERAVLRHLEGGCQLPIAAYGRIDTSGELEVDACVATLDGTTVLRDRIRAPMENSVETGSLLADRLIKMGAKQILEGVRAAH